MMMYFRATTTTISPLLIFIVVIVNAGISCVSAFTTNNPGGFYSHQPAAPPSFVGGQQNSVPFHRAIDDTSLHVSGRIFPSLNTDQQQNHQDNWDGYYRQLHLHSRSQKWHYTLDHRSGATAVSPLSVVASYPHGQDLFSKRITGTKRILAAMIVFLSAKRLMLAGPAILQLYQTFPMVMAMITCGTNSAVADLISQFKSIQTTMNNGSTNNLVELFSMLNLKKTMSCSTYGVMILGFLGNLAYSKLLPFLFGTKANLSTIVSQSLFDNLIAAPLFWLPTNYIMKALFFRDQTSIRDSLRLYWKDITQAKLLIKYWSVWIPAQFLTFSIIPTPFRVPFVAAIGFCWAMILSSLSAKKAPPATA